MNTCCVQRFWITTRENLFGKLVRFIKNCILSNGKMTTINTILNELKDVPANKLDDLCAIIRSLKSNVGNSEIATKQILSFAGSFSSFSAIDYQDFLEETKRIRSNLFDRDIYV